MTRWRILHSPPMSGAANMALDEVLMERAARTGETVLRTYSWSTPTISFGRNQRAMGIYDRDRIDAHQLGVIRRPTGGRALLHHREVTYSVTGLASTTSLASRYAAINELLVDALRHLGVDASVAAARGPTPAPGAAPCFDEPSAGEIVAGGRKLVGSAQWRSGHAFLQHGSILVENDQSLLPSLARVPLRSVPAPATLASLMGRTPELTEVADALSHAARARAERVDPLADDELPPDALHDVAKRYCDESWTWRR